MQTISTTQPKARKIHRCDYCCQIIKVSEVYERQFIVGDGAWTWKNHISCQKIAEKLDMFRQSDGEGVDSDSFTEFINQEFEVITKNLYRSVPFLKRLNTVKKHHGLCGKTKV